MLLGRLCLVLQKSPPQRVCTSAVANPSEYMSPSRMHCALLWSFGALWESENITKSKNNCIYVNFPLEDWSRVLYYANNLNTSQKYKTLIILLYIIREASLFMGWGGRYPAEWAKFFGRAYCSGGNFLEVYFVVGEKFWMTKFAKTAITRYSKWANRPDL